MYQIKLLKCLLLLKFSFFLFLIPKFKLQSEMERQKERSFISWLAPQMATGSRLDHIEAKDEIFSSLSHGCEVPSTWAILCHFPRHINRELDQAWSSRENNSCEMLVSQEEA